MALFFAETQGLRHELGSATDYHKNPDALKKVAKQFEALYLQMVLKSMRQASSVFESELFSGQELETYREMHDQQLAVELAQSGGLGLADMMVRQLTGQTVPDGIADVRPTRHEAPFIQPSFNRVAVSSKNQPTVQGAITPLSEDDQRQFIQRLLPEVQVVAKQMGVDPRILISQAALETGWGKHMLAKPDGSSSFNLFGIKADKQWAGDKVVAKTTEFQEGLMQLTKATFKAYKNFAESCQDYVHLLRNNPRYDKAMQAATQPRGFVQALASSGYATDPQYAQKVWKIFKSPLMQRVSSK